MVRVNLAAPQRRNDGHPYLACLIPGKHDFYLSILLPGNSFVVITVMKSDKSFYNLKKVHEIVEGKDN